MKRLTKLSVVGLLFGASAISAPVAKANAPTDAVMSIASVRPVALAGGFVEVNVFVTKATGVRVYELYLNVAGGDSGTLELDSISVDSKKKNFLFSGDAILPAIDKKGKRVAVVNQNDGRDIAAGSQAYLATFKYKVSPDASGKFQVSINTQKSYMSDSNVQNIAYSAPATTEITVRSSDIDRANTKKRSSGR